MDGVVVFDLFGVIARTQTPQAKWRIEQLAGVSGEVFWDAYWACRPAYDAGQPSEEYWRAVANSLGTRFENVEALVSADLASAVEEIAVTAFAAAAERARHLDDLEDQLFRFGRVVMSAPELRTVLSNLTIPAQYKRQLLDTLLEGKVTADARQLIDEAAEHPRGRSVDVTLDHYAQWTAQWRQRLIAVARVALPLTDRQRERLIAALEGAYGHEVHLDVIVDPRVEGGISVQIGDEFIDGSVASRLAALRRRLAA